MRFVDGIMCANWVYVERAAAQAPETGASAHEEAVDGSEGLCADFGDIYAHFARRASSGARERGDCHGGRRSASALEEEARRLRSEIYATFAGATAAFFVGSEEEPGADDDDGRFDFNGSVGSRAGTEKRSHRSPGAVEAVWARFVAAERKQHELCAQAEKLCRARRELSAARADKATGPRSAGCVGAATVRCSTIKSQMCDHFVFVGRPSQEVGRAPYAALYGTVSRWQLPGQSARA